MHFKVVSLRFKKKSDPTNMFQFKFYLNFKQEKNTNNYVQKVNDINYKQHFIFCSVGSTRGFRWFTCPPTLGLPRENVMCIEKHHHVSRPTQYSHRHWVNPPLKHRLATTPLCSASASSSGLPLPLANITRDLGDITVY